MTEERPPGLWKRLTAELDKAPFQVTGKYLGRHPDHPRAKQVVTFKLSEAGVQVLSAFGKAFVTLPWDQVSSVVFEGPEQAQQRFSVTRLAMFGGLALGMPKKGEKVAYATVSGDFGDFHVEIKGKLARDLAGSAARWTNRIGRSAPAGPRALSAAGAQTLLGAGEQAPAVPDITSRLTELAALREAGHLSDDEFSAAKAKLLGT